MSSPGLTLPRATYRRLQLTRDLKSRLGPSWGGGIFKNPEELSLSLERELRSLFAPQLTRPHTSLAKILNLEFSPPPPQTPPSAASAVLMERVEAHRGGVVVICIERGAETSELLRWPPPPLPG
jgi:hypothetical protein